MTFLELQTFINPLINTINESNNDSLHSIKNFIKEFIFSNKINIKQLFPKLKSYISNLSVNNIIKKNIIRYISILLLSIGQPALSQEIKSITPIEINNTISDYHFTYKIGEYNFDEKNLNEYIKSFTKKGNKVTGNITVTISNDPENHMFKNYAIDDTYGEKIKGGLLLNKRINKVKECIDNIQKEVLPIILDIKVFGAESDKREIIVSDFKTESKEEDTIPYLNIIKTEQDEIDFPSGNGNRDITNMSRNLQFIEILKIVDIKPKPFFNNDIKKGDEYSRWIVNVRKNIKSFFSRLKDAYPEYNITYNTNAKVKTDITGARRGMSQLKNQYIETFESFRYKDNTKKWRKILGITFPYMTEDLASKLDNNIEQILELLEDMYGSTLLQFKYSKL